MNKNERITMRLTPHDKLKLDELTNALGTSYSMLLRIIITDFFDKNEDRLNYLIDHNTELNAANK